MHKHILLVLLVGMGSVCYGQNSDKAIGFSVYLGYHRMQVDNLNNMLMANGLQRMKTGYLSLGVGVNARKERAFYQFSFDIDENNKTTYNADGIGTSGYSLSLGFSVGYIVPILGSDFEWVPYVGFSSSRFYLTVNDIPPVNLGFQSMLSTRTSVNYSNRTNAIVFGSRFLFPTGPVTYGLEVSFGVSVFGEWTSEGGVYPIQDAPYIDTSRFKIGYFIMLTAWGKDRQPGQ